VRAGVERRFEIALIRLRHLLPQSGRRENAAKREKEKPDHILISDFQYASICVVRSFGSGT